MIVISVGMPFVTPSGFVFIASDNWDRCHHHSYKITVMLFVAGLIFIPHWEMGFGVFNFVLNIYYKKQCSVVSGLPVLFSKKIIFI